MMETHRQQVQKNYGWQWGHSTLAIKYSRTKRFNLLGCKRIEL